MSESETKMENPSDISMKTEGSKQMLRAFREHVVDMCVSIARVGFFWIPGGDEAKGRALMTFHILFTFGTVLLFFILPPRHPLRVVIFMAAVLTFLQQVTLRGCVLTRAEHRLTGRKETCIDPFLIISGLAVTNDMRYTVTIVGTFVATSLMGWVVLCDFLHCY